MYPTTLQFYKLWKKRYSSTNMKVMFAEIF